MYGQKGYGIVFPTACRLCGRDVLNLNGLRMHIQRKRHNPPVDYKTYMLQEYGVDTIEMSPENRGVGFPHTCALCGKAVKSLTGLANHLKALHPERGYGSYMRSFVGVDVGPDPKDMVMCRICDGEFLNLAAHLTKKHGITKDEYEKKYGPCEFQKASVSKRVLVGVEKHIEDIRGLSPEDRLKRTMGDRMGGAAYLKWRRSMSSVFTLEWFVSRYGKDGERRYEARGKNLSDWAKTCTRNGNNGVNWSKISQELFWKVYAATEFDRVYFGELNHEFGCGTNKNFDFVVVDNKKVVEFNGNAFHPSPLLGEEERKRWRQPFTCKDALTVERQDAVKIEAAKKKGYSVMIVWGDDYKKNPDAVAEAILDFLKEGSCVV